MTMINLGEVKVERVDGGRIVVTQGAAEPKFLSAVEQQALCMLFDLEREGREIDAQRPDRGAE